MDSIDFINAIDIAQKIDDLIGMTQSKQPYSINLIDELHINENANSRILCKLLQYQDNHHEYSILKSLISYISLSNPSFSYIQVSKPKISQELERIDVWIRDEDYAIIFENKIYGAADQKEQLSRYIETTLNTYSYTKEQVFVVYLSSGNFDPSDQSWGMWKDVFKERYIGLSFRDDIIVWLKEYVLPNCTIKETLLISAIEQYIDYLEGLYRKRTYQQNILSMNSELLKQIGIYGASFGEQISQINALLSTLGLAKNELETYRAEHVKKVMSTFIALTTDILSNDWIHKDRITTGDGWYYLFDKKWISQWCIHLEWSNISCEDLFSRTKYKMVLHAEGDYKTNSITQGICENLSFTQRNYTLWEHNFDSAKPLGLMSELEMKNFLENTYHCDELKRIIDCLNKYLLTSKLN